jgi:uncharacterized protein (TIGR00369 family)
MKPATKDYEARTRNIFRQAPFVTEMGIEPREIGPGWCDSQLTILPGHMQHDQVVHAGVLATMADHTAGAASYTLIQADEIVLTVEFKINLLRPATGETLRCRAQVLRPGKMLFVTESEVFARSEEAEKLVAKAIVTLAVVKNFGP